MLFCGECSSVHQTDVIQTMKDMINQLKIQEKQIKSYNNYVQSYKTALDINHNMANELTTQIKQSEQEITRKIKNGLHEKGKEREFYENSQVLNLTEVTNYQRLLNDHLKNNQLIDEETLLTIKNSLDSNKKRPLTAPSDPKLELGKIYREKLSQFPFDMDTTNSFDNTTDQKQGNKKLFVTVSLTTIKEFQSPLLRTFSVGNLPSVISLPQKYFEYFFVRKGNSLLLKSTTSIDLYNRGSGLELAIRTKIQDRLLAADWCEKSQKLILIGNHNLYEFDMDRRIKPKKYSCEPVQGDPLCWPRFVRCMNRFIFYAYKADAQSYILEKHDLTRSNNINLVPLKSVNVNGNIRCMCVTYSFIAIVTRREKKPEQLSLISKNNNNIEQFEHVLCVYDHTLQEKKTEKLPNLKWVTGICSLGENKYIICDPRAQQLVLIHLTDDNKSNILFRRFKIGAVNVCTLPNGMLVLWLQKQYASSPTGGKLHFISAPHLTGRMDIAKSFPLLEQVDSKEKTRTNEIDH